MTVLIGTTDARSMVRSSGTSATREAGAQTTSAKPPVLGRIAATFLADRDSGDVLAELTDSSRYLQAGNAAEPRRHPAGSP